MMDGGKQMPRLMHEIHPADLPVRTGKALVVVCLLLLTATVASAECEWNVTVDWCCDDNYTAGWFYNTTIENWTYASLDDAATVWFILNISGEPFYGYCKDKDIVVGRFYTFNATIIPAEPSCKNNSIAYILNTWPQSCAHCENVSAAQSALWYFWYSEDTACRLATPHYNHSARPGETGWESRWIPDCTAHPEACSMINASINRSVPYKLKLTPSSGSFPRVAPIELEAVVSYCEGTGQDEVTVRFVTGPGCSFSESGTESAEVNTTGGRARATLKCDPSVDTATVSATIKDANWFELIMPCDEHQGLIRVVNIPPHNASFEFVTSKVPALSRSAALILGFLLLVVALTTMARRRRET
jgi:hypothetical protein